MDTEIGAIVPQLSSGQTWNGDAESQRLSASTRKIEENTEEIVALFRAGRLFRFPVRVRIRIAGGREAKKSTSLLDSEGLAPITERSGAGVGRFVLAQIE